MPSFRLFCRYFMIFKVALRHKEAIKILIYEQECFVTLVYIASGGNVGDFDATQYKKAGKVSTAHAEFVLTEKN